jgi:1-acyl-sn-glycerol-3-phosphate acyltransferase
VRILKSLLGKGISVAVFPEGTFNLTDRPLKEFYDGAFRIAVETQTPVRPVLFLDANRRMHYQSLFSLTPGRCRILYMDEIPVEGMGLKDVGALKNQVHDLMEAALLRYAN